MILTFNQTNGETAMRSTVKWMSYLVWLTQLGLSVVTPLAGFILLAVWLHRSCGWGGWVFLPGILLGLMGAVGGLYSGFKTLHRLTQAEETPPPPGSNRHD